MQLFFSLLWQWLCNHFRIILRVVAMFFPDLWMILKWFCVMELEQFSCYLWLVNEFVICFLTGFVWWNGFWIILFFLWCLIDFGTIFQWIIVWWFLNGFDVIGSFLNNCWMFCDFGLVFCFYDAFIMWKRSGCLRYILLFGDLKLLNDFVCWSGFWIMSACPLKDFNMFFCAIVKWFLNEYVWWMVFDRFFHDFVWLLMCFVWFLCDGVVSEWLLKDLFVMFI